MSQASPKEGEVSPPKNAADAAEAAEEERGNLLKACLTLARSWHLAHKERITKASEEDPQLEAKVINKAFTSVVLNCIDIVGKEDEASLFKDRFVPFEVDHSKYSEYVNVELDNLLTGNPDVFNLTPEENAIIPEIEQASRELADEADLQQRQEQAEEASQGSGLFGLDITKASGGVQAVYMIAMLGLLSVVIWVMFSRLFNEKDNYLKTKREEKLKKRTSKDKKSQ